MEDGAIGKFNSPQQLMRLLETDLSTKAQWAALALKMGRLEEATTVMAEVIREKKHLTVNERFVFALAYQERAKECRETCHCIEKRRRVEHQECERAMTIVHESVEYELSDMLHELCHLIGTYLLPDSTVEEKVFYNKMLADYTRYLTVAAQNTDRDSLIQNTEMMYQVALNCAEELPAHHPYRLATTINYACFYCDVHRDIDKALAITEKCVSDAQNERQSPAATEYYATDKMLQLAKEDIQRWRTARDKFKKLRNHGPTKRPLETGACGAIEEGRRCFSEHIESNYVIIEASKESSETKSRKPLLEVGPEVVRTDVTKAGSGFPLEKPMNCDTPGRCEEDPENLTPTVTIKIDSDDDALKPAPETGSCDSAP